MSTSWRNPVEPSGGVDRAAIAAEWTADLAQLRALLTSADRTALGRRSRGTRWTNEELLFHMVFGYLVTRTLLPLVRLLGRLPAPFGRGWAALLDAAARPFHVVNYWGSVAAARVFDRTRMGALADRTVAGLRRALDRETEDGLHRGMPFPTRWDPYFSSRMSLADVYLYPTMHFRHHARQLTLRAPPGL